jgi:hypothetical protein
MHKTETVVIPTERLELVLQTPDEVLAWVASLPPADRAEVSPDWLARVRSTHTGDPWALSYTVVERATRSAIGGCAFKGPPDSDGMVELAYGIDLPIAAVGSLPKRLRRSVSLHAQVAGCGSSVPTRNRTTLRPRGCSTNAGSARSARSSPLKMGLSAGGNVVCKHK